MEPTALGIPPIPSWRQAPLGMWGTMRLATARSTSEGSPPPPSWAMGGLLPSTTKSTSLMLISLPVRPYTQGMFWLTSTIMVLALSIMSARWEAARAKLKLPWASMGVVCTITTSTSTFSR